MVFGFRTYYSIQKQFLFLNFESSPSHRSSSSAGECALKSTHARSRQNVHSCTNAIVFRTDSCCRKNLFELLILSMLLWKPSLSLKAHVFITALKVFEWPVLMQYLLTKFFNSLLKPIRLIYNYAKEQYKLKLPCIFCSLVATFAARLLLVYLLYQQCALYNLFSAHV